MSPSGTKLLRNVGQRMSALPGTSDVDLFRYRDGIIHLNAKIFNRAFDLSVAEQELDSSRITSTPIDQRRLRSPQRMGAELLGIQTDAGDPFGD
jgi:hypothetical protein